MSATPPTPKRPTHESIQNNLYAMLNSVYSKEAESCCSIAFLPYSWLYMDPHYTTRGWAIWYTFMLNCCGHANAPVQSSTTDFLSFRGQRMRNRLRALQPPLRGPSTIRQALVQTTDISPAKYRGQSREKPISRAFYRFLRLACEYFPAFHIMCEMRGIVDHLRRHKVAK